MGYKHLFAIILAVLVNITSLIAQDCVANIENLVINENNSELYSISFDLLSNDKFEVNLYDEDENQYIINTSKIVPDFGTDDKVELINNNGSITINNVKKELIEHKLMLVLIARTGSCKPVKIELI